MSNRRYTTASKSTSSFKKGKIDWQSTYGQLDVSLVNYLVVGPCSRVKSEPSTFDLIYNGAHVQLRGAAEFNS
jgi:hypothetical protein